MARVLLVEDDSGQLEIRKLIFERAGHVVSIAESAAEAIAAARETLPDVAVTDLRLPRLEDGIELVRVLVGTTRVIVLSGASIDSSTLPADRFFTKPCLMRELLKAVEELAPHGVRP